MFNEAIFREIRFPSLGMMGECISRNVASLNVLVSDVINVLYYELNRQAKVFLRITWEKPLATRYKKHILQTNGSLRNHPKQSYNKAFSIRHLPVTCLKHYSCKRKNIFFSVFRIHTIIRLSLHEQKCSVRLQQYFNSCERKLILNNEQKET